jgi:hypothetical protein
MIVLFTVAAHPCFSTLDPESCRILDRHCTWLKIPAGSSIAAQREQRLFCPERAPEGGASRDAVGSHVADIEAGSFFGEPSALEGAPRSPSLFAVKESTLAKMPSAVFAGAACRRRRLREAVAAALVARNRAMTQRVVEAAHIYGSRLLRVGPARSRPPQSSFGEQRAGARCASGNPWRARR